MDNPNQHKLGLTKERPKAIVYHLPMILIWKAHAALFPLPSVASQMIFVCPMLKLLPDGGSQVTETFPELSDTLGLLHTTMAVSKPSSVLTDWLLTHVITGASISMEQDFFITRFCKIQKECKLLLQKKDIFFKHLK